MNKTPAKMGKLDQKGDLVIDERETEEAVYKTVKYGVIKLIGDPNEHRISYQSIKMLADKPPLFNGDVIIPELHLKIPINRVIFQQIREEEQKVVKNFAKLPTSIVLLDLEKDEIIGREDLKTRKKWREAIAHYQQGTDGKEFYIAKHQLKRCLYLRREEGESEFYAPTVYRIEKYGIEQTF